MVKADVRRDYYADLGLTPSAETEDIKKQFRKLALKYHPDRNPGRETEFIAKFQAIQAAHEILGDPQQRLRYDTERLRAGYGKLYGPGKPTTPRKTAPNNFASTASTRPQSAKQSFSGRPQSFHQQGPSSGAQRYASYARAAPKQPWEKGQDDGQTRADAYRGFQDIKNGWSRFNPRTGGAEFPNGSPRMSKSAYEYFASQSKTSSKPATPEPSARPQSSTKKKQGFAPRAAGGDEPMAAKTASYNSAHRAERPQSAHFGAAPSPTARKAAAGFGNRAANSRTPDVERAGSKYAGTGGEKTFFSSEWLGRSSSVRNSPDSSKSHSRTSPPSPTPAESGRHRSASPKVRKERDNRNYTSTSSSDLSDSDDARPSAYKPKAVPKSRLHRHQKFSDFRTSQGASFKDDSDDTASPVRPFGKEPFGPGAFKSSSQDNLRKPFSVEDWGNSTFFPPSSPSSKEDLRPPGGVGDSNRTTPAPASQPSNESVRESAETASQQKPTPFAEAKFDPGVWEEDWAERFRDMLRAMPMEDGAQQQHTANAQRPRSPRKPTRPATKLRPAPQPVSVSTEAEESKSTVGGGNPSARAAEEGEAMDLDDDIPAKPANVNAGAAQSISDSGKENEGPKSRPTSSGQGKDDNSQRASKLFDMKNLGNTVPFTYSNNGGIDDLQDIHASLPFESRAKVPRTTMQDIRARELICPNPPKRPEPPKLVPVSVGSSQLGLPRAAWDRYVLEMNSYMREWNAFNRRILTHFNARQEAIETGMAPNWIGSIGDSARLRVNAQNDDEDGGKGGSGDESDDNMVAGSAKGGYSAYLRGLDEDAKVQKHWDVARELHRECILKLGKMREWILNGGRLI
ncbi:DnaJ domain protein [Aspergillus terreus]|uniref:DnaJ domain protein n=1 Tax=Aspergillus terreus TaxID=33178 RepID=A0A5M3Z162_ASPTE|nr:hypothetical protein ATETN484_0007030700 [Aspergillus terreus]GFF16112.1 DnaJ domain protein [Aspergillus terreus]